MKKRHLIYLLLFLFSCSAEDENKIALYKIEKDRLFGFINKEGKVIIAPQFHYVSDFSEGLAYARKDSLYGFVNGKGKYVIQFSEKGECLMMELMAVLGMGPEISNIRFSNGLAVFIDPKAEKYGYLNKQGEFEIAPTFESALPFSEGLAAVKLNGKYGYIDDKGKLIIDYQFDKAGNFYCERAVCLFSKVNKEDFNAISWNTVVIDKAGSIINSPQGMVQIGNFSEKIASKLVAEEQIFNIIKGKYPRGYTFIDKDLNEISKYHFDFARNFKQSWAAIKYNGKWGFIKNDFETIIDPVYENAQSFSDSLAPVKNDGKWGFINMNGEIVIENKYDSVMMFQNKLAYVIYENHGFKINGYVDKMGKLIWYSETH